MGTTLNGKKKNLLLQEQILSCKNISHFGRALSSREAYKKTKKLFHFAEMAEKH